MFDVNTFKAIIKELAYHYPDREYYLITAYFPLAHPYSPLPITFSDFKTMQCIYHILLCCKTNDIPIMTHYSKTLDSLQIVTEKLLN